MKVGCWKLSQMSNGLRVAGFLVGLVMILIGLGMVFSHDIITKLEGLVIAPLLITLGVGLIVASIKTGD